MATTEKSSAGSRNNDVYRIRVEVLVATAAVCLVVGYIGRGIVESGGRGPSASTSVVAPANAAPIGAPAGTSVVQGAPAQSSVIASLQAAANRSRNDAGPWTKLGNAYFDSGQYELAIDAYKRSLEIKASNPDVITDMGIMFRRTGRPDEAIAAFESASRIDPTHQMSRFNKGVVLLYDKLDREGARKEWQELARMNPGFRAPDGQVITRLVDSLK